MSKMDTSIESLNQEPDHKKAKSERENRKALRRMGNPLWGFAWRFVLCCAMIDLPFWAYFHFVKEVPILVGLEQMQNEFQAKMNKPKEPEPFRVAQADSTPPIKKPS